jgi:hypothetical protein
MNRRNFLRLIGIGGAAAMVPFAPVPDENQLNHRLEHVCFSLGRWSRKRNAQIHRVIMTDESGRLVLDGQRSQSRDEFNRNMYLLTDGSFHLADRNTENYTQIVYCVEPRYLMRADELSVFVHTENGCHRFPLVFM